MVVLGQFYYDTETEQGQILLNAPPMVALGIFQQLIVSYMMQQGKEAPDEEVRVPATDTSGS